MKKLQTANQLSGRAIGSIFFSGFGTLWLILALYALEWLRMATISAILLGLAVLILIALNLLRKAKSWPRVPDDPALGRAFNRVNAVQWIAVGIVVFVMHRMHLDAYALNAVGAIVGLHLFPLARLFHYSPHYATGTVLVIWAAASALLVPAEHLQGVAALGTGLILWLSAAGTLAIALQGARQSADSLTC